MSMKRPNQIGTTLRCIRIACDLKSKEMAERTKLSPGYISAVESNLKIPPLDTLQAYSDVLGITVEDILWLDHVGEEVNYNYQRLLLVTLGKLVSKEENNI